MIRRKAARKCQCSGKKNLRRALDWKQSGWMWGKVRVSGAVA